MSIISKFLEMTRLTDDGADDDYDYDDDYTDDNDAEDEAPKKKLFNSRKSDDADASEDRSSRLFSRSSNKVVPMKRNGGMEVSLVKPNSMEDTREIADMLLNGKAVVLNMEGMRMEMAQRIIDFTCGSTYSINGNLQKISNYIFIATPANVELSGDFPEILADGSLDITRMNVHY